MTMLISCYSFTAVCQRAQRLMSAGGSLLTLTYMGAERVMPHYNVMGVAKAALEASVRYLAEDLGRQNDSRQRAVGRADQDAGRVRHRRLPLHPQVEPAQRPAAPQRHAGRGRRRRRLSAQRPFHRRHRRDPSRRLRLQHRRHAGAGRRRADPRDAGRLHAAAAPMSGNSFGRLFRVTSFGESHGPAIGCVIDGVPPRLPLAEADIQVWLDRRRPGQSRFTTQRREPDRVQILSGVFEGLTTGAPIGLLIVNEDARSKDYSRDQGPVPPWPCRLHLPGQVRHPRLPRRRPVERAGDGDAGGGRRRRAHGAGRGRAHPRCAGADRPAPDRPRPLGLGGDRAQPVLEP